MTEHEVVAEGLSAPSPLLWASAGVLLVFLCVLVWLLVRALRAHRRRLVETAGRGAGGAPGDDTATAEVLAVIADAQHILTETARDLDDPRRRLERLRLEADLRRRAAEQGPGGREP